MKKTILLAAIAIISAVAVNSASAQYYNRGRDYRDIRHERADIRYDRQRLDYFNHERRVDAYYGNREAYRYNGFRAGAEQRAIARDRRDIYRDRRDIRRGHY